MKIEYRYSMLLITISFAVIFCFSGAALAGNSSYGFQDKVENIIEFQDDVIITQIDKETAYVVTSLYDKRVYISVGEGIKYVVPKEMFIDIIYFADSLEINNIRNEFRLISAGIEIGISLRRMENGNFYLSIRNNTYSLEFPIESESMLTKWIPFADDIVCGYYRQIFSN